MTGSTTTPLDVADAFVSAWNRHDMAALADLFAADAHFVNVVGLWWRGRGEIQAAHEATHRSMFRDSQLHQLATEVRHPVDGIAIARTHWRLEGHRAPDDSPLPPREGVLVQVMVPREGGWQIIDAQNTDKVEGVLSRPQ